MYWIQIHPLYYLWVRAVWKWDIHSFGWQGRTVKPDGMIVTFEVHHNIPYLCPGKSYCQPQEPSRETVVPGAPSVVTRNDRADDGPDGGRTATEGTSPDASEHGGRTATVDVGVPGRDEMDSVAQEKERLEKIYMISIRYLLSIV